MEQFVNGQENDKLLKRKHKKTVELMDFMEMLCYLPYSYHSMVNLYSLIYPQRNQKIIQDLNSKMLINILQANSTLDFKTLKKDYLSSLIYNDNIEFTLT